MSYPRIDRATRVIVQGITGRAGRMHTRMMRDYGTRIVAGVSPKAGGADVDGVPVFASCREAITQTRATASVLLVGAAQLLVAIEDAVQAGIKLIVTPTEGMPAHDALRARRLTLEAGVMWIGASTPGVAVAGQAKLGFVPEASLKPGPLGLMAKSGTLSYECGYRLAQRGIGTTVWIGVGGDLVKGTRFAELVPFYAADTQTEALLVIGEIGGNEEQEFATALAESRFHKPVFALIAGRSSPEGVTMGHAGALVHGSHGGYAAKKAALEKAGATVFASLDEMTTAITAWHGSRQRQERLTK
ncbi:MAG: succinate--CoA ligase subunit alpha [Betaproteobacteria bacterium]|nr:succinate--CoA ligase subunit alpha [Betaproteobacteria bacterium]